MLRHDNTHWCLRWFDKWEPVLDEALTDLPKHPLWPNELLRDMFHWDIGARKKVVLVTERETPIAIVGLRVRGGGIYDPLGQTFVIPHFHLVGKVELTTEILTSLRVPLIVNWWRMPLPPPSPSLPTVRSFQTKPHYILRLEEDPEVYWRSSGQLKTVRNMRNRCKNFKLLVDPVGGAGWVTRRWGEDWRIALDDVTRRILAAEYLERLGKYHSLLLQDGDKPVAGCTILVHGNDIVGLVNHRDRAYDRYGVGIHLMDLSFQWAKQSGFHSYDIGTTQQYKAGWAPVSNDHQWAMIEMSSEYYFRLRQIRKALTAVLEGSSRAALHVGKHLFANRHR